jgi:exonuclease III
MNCGDDDGGTTLEGDEPQTKDPEVHSAAKMPPTHRRGTTDNPAWMSKPKHEKYMSWNANSLQKRWDSGDLIELLVRHDPTTIAVSKIKTSIADFKDQTSLRHVLKSIGYAYCIFNWCTQTQQNGTKGSGNFGIAIISKTPLTAVRFGIGHDRLDKEGRAITATVNGHTFV